MKILVVSPAPPNRFHRIRLKNILSALSSDHQIRGVYLNVGKPKMSSKFHKIINKSHWKSIMDCALKFSLPQPLEVSYCHSNALKNEIAQIASAYDLILVKRLRAAQYLPSNLSIPVILDSTDAMSLSFARLKSKSRLIKKPLFWEEWAKYLIYEKRLAERFKNWVVCSKPDADYLKKTLPKKINLFIVPNVVDTKYYSSHSKPLSKTLLFSGLLEKDVNQNAIFFFLENVFPTVKKAIPEVKLNIVGPNPPKKVRAFQDKSVNIAGKVPDIRKWIEKSSCIVVPTQQATGTRNKILQAWSHARPVVSTSAGAKGIKAAHKKNILIADNPIDFANSVANVLTNSTLATNLGKNARKQVSAYYSLKVLRNRYNQVINRVVKNYES